MTNIRSIVVAGVLTFGFAAAAAAQAAPGTDARVGHVQQREGKRGPGNRRALQRQLFKGIQLSDAEKSNVRNVEARYAPQLEALREQEKPEFKAAREARQRGDTAALKALWDKAAPQREQAKRLLEAERADLRTALGPANQPKFDANVQELETRVAQRAAKEFKKGGRRAPGASGLRE